MARIRSIKPEFPQSETIGRLSRDARLLFIQIWTIVDDEGRTRGSSRMLASLLYPYDDDAPSLIGDWLQELEAAGCIRRYDIGGASYLDIPNWLKHQKIDKPSKSRLPEFVEGSRAVVEASRKVALDLGPSILDLGPGPRTVDPPSPRSVDARSPRAHPSFDTFWEKYPHKVGKIDARKAFEKAIKAHLVEFHTMLAALDRYRAKADDRPWCNPATWLNEGRWDDQPAEVSQNGKSVLAVFDRLEQNLAGGDDRAPGQDDLLSLPPR